MNINRYIYTPGGLLKESADYYTYTPGGLYERNARNRSRISGKRLIIILGIFLIPIIVLAVLFCLLPPRVTSIVPSDASNNVAIYSSLTINFNKPVVRQELQYKIIPEAYGEWQYKNPLIKNHLYRTLVFVPAINFNPDTEYQVELTNITNPIGLGTSNEFVFHFKTRAIPPEADFPIQNLEITLLDATSSIAKDDNATSVKEITTPDTSTSLERNTVSKPKITILDIPIDWQDHPLSCEAASLKMALTKKGIYVSEGDIMDKVGYDSTPRQKNTWGDPNNAFVGNINGKMCSTGYGVHWEPIARAANNWCAAESFSGWNLINLTKEIESGNPVIVWGVLPVKTLHECTWYTPEGKYITTFQETHVRLATGFIGEVNNPSKIILNDPLSGKLYWSAPYFLTNWKASGYSGVVLR